MSQANDNIFGLEFFPTPRHIAQQMLKRISDDARYFLEPSAGKGDIADIIRTPMTAEEVDAMVEAWAKESETTDVDPDERRRRKHRVRNYNDDRRHRDISIDVIELHPDLCAVLRSKGYTVVGDDWLAYNGPAYSDAILMNPPFSQGARHLLKAWDWMHHGEIVCLLNQETIDNPHTEERQRLVKIVMENGDVTPLGECFSTAKRRTNVSVAMVYLKKVGPDDSHDLWGTPVNSEQYHGVDVGDDPNMIAIRDNLGNMEQWFNMANHHWVKGIAEIRKAAIYMRQNKVASERYGKNGRGNQSLKELVSLAFDNIHTCRAEFLRYHRREAWTSVFTQMEFNKWLDSKQQERFMRDVERDATIPFTADNIKATLENVYLSRKKLFDESVAGVFDELCDHAIENGSGPERPACLDNRRNSEGWKTNDTYKVNDRLVFPYGCKYAKDYNGFSCAYGNADRIYSDLDRILCVLDGVEYGSVSTVGGALQRAFQVKYDSLSDQVTESFYFNIRFYKKGTVHLHWKRPDLLEAFNKRAAAGKKWLGGDTSFKKAAWRENPDYYCQHNGHDWNSDDVCKRCEAPKVDPLDAVECELCRSVMEHTGVQSCPLHPLDCIAPSMPVPALEAAAVEMPWVEAVEIHAANHAEQDLNEPGIFDVMSLFDDPEIITTSPPCEHYARTKETL